MSVYASSSVEVVKKVESVEIFDFNEISKTDVQNFDGSSSGSAKIALQKINSPLFAAAKNGVIVALADVEYKENNVLGDDSGGDAQNKVGVIARYFESHNVEWNTEGIKAAIGKGKTQLTAQKDEDKTLYATRTFVMNGYGENIYIFVVSINKSGDKNWDFKLIKGAINGAKPNKNFEWNLESLTGLKNSDTLKADKVTSFTADRSAFLFNKKSIMFVVKGESEKDQTKKNMAAVFLFEEGGKDLELVDHENTKISYPTFFQWEGKIFKIFTDDLKNDGTSNVKEFDAGEGPKFKETKHSIARLRDFLKNKNNFITAAVPDKGNVLLFTEQREVKSDGVSNGNKNVYLWMTDGTRVSCAGTIFPNEFAGTSYVSLLYTDNKLFALHQTVETTAVNQGNNKKIYFAFLKDQLENITNTLSAWEENNDKIENLYENAASPTTTDINFTDGIVGFLSGTKDDITWEDGYLYANATVTPSGKKENPTKENNGFKFTGTGAGAQWLLSKENEDQRYNFINPGFTLVATVTIGGSANGKKFDNSILGVGITGNTKITVGLWCTENGKWGVKVGNDQEVLPSLDISCKRNKKYYVALILNESKKTLVHVDGQQLTELSIEGRLKIEEPKKIEYFYFGAVQNTQTNTDVTITNVLLYNRPFTTNEVEQLKPEKNTEANNKQNQNTDIKQQNPEESTAQTDSSPSATKNEKEEQSSSPPPPTTEDSAVRVGVVGVLCFMLFGVFTLLGRYVY